MLGGGFMRLRPMGETLLNVFVLRSLSAGIEVRARRSQLSF